MDHLLGCRWNKYRKRKIVIPPRPDQASSVSNFGWQHCSMATTTSTYRAVVRVGAAVAPVLGLFSPKLRTATQARTEAGDRLLEWARWHRDPSRPTVWFHAASVGEGLQAESVLSRFRRLRPECQAVYTHFSPSAEPLAARLPVDAADYLPYDFPAKVDRLLEALEPALLVFVKLDLWPELSTRAALSGTGVVMVAATVSRGSGRLRWPARELLEPGYRAVSRAAAISTEDATRLARLGVQPERILVLGDPRFDSVIERVAGVPAEDLLLRLGGGGATLVAGSTWPEDEQAILAAYARVRHRFPKARLILVPHEPTPQHLTQIERRAAALGLPEPTRLSVAEAPPPLLLVERVGILAQLYGAGTMAYVGGGFGRAGLHSVLEPAAWSLPVAFGPRWQNSRDASLLLNAGAAVALPLTRHAAARALHSTWEGWLGDDAGRQAQGRQAREIVESGMGASDRTAAMLDDLISQRRPQRSSHEARSAPL